MLVASIKKKSTFIKNRRKTQSRSRKGGGGAAFERLSSYDCVVIKLEIDFAVRWAANVP